MGLFLILKPVNVPCSCYAINYRTMTEGYKSTVMHRVLESVWRDFVSDSSVTRLVVLCINKFVFHMLAGLDGMSYLRSTKNN